MSGAPLAWKLKTRRLDLDRPLVMGIVNVTPDSFSDGGLAADTDSAIAHAQALAGRGADILDVGGESTRPGAAPVSVDVEMERVIGVIAALATRLPECLISVDTRRLEVAREALERGACIINDVTGLPE